MIIINTNPFLGRLFLLALLFFSKSLFAVASYRLPSEEWRQISLPLNPGNTNNTVSAIFEDDITADGTVAATYKTDWIVYAYDSAAGSYVLKELNDTLAQGVGYWIIQTTGRDAQLDMPAESVAGSDPFTIPLVVPPAGGSAQWNMLGHPFDTPVNFNEYTIKTSSGNCSGQGCDPAQAKTKNIFHNEVWRYSGKAYEKVFGNTPLNPWDGFWCATLTESTGKNPQVLVAGHHALQPPIAGNWTLKFQDEFNGHSLNPDNWRVGGHYLGIAGSAGNSADQVKVRNGKLELIAKKQLIKFVDKGGNLTDFGYVTGEVSTFQQFRQRYGYFEAKIKYDVRQGVWPAFWTMPDRGDPAADNYGNKDWSYESFMRFNLDGISQPVTSALLKVKVTGFVADPFSSSNNIADITVHTLNSQSWEEGTINWNNKPDYDPAWLHQFIWKKPPVNTPPPSNTSNAQKDPGYTQAEYDQAQLDSNNNNLYPQDPPMQAAEDVSGAASGKTPAEIAVGEEIVIDVTDYIREQIAANRNTAGFALVDTFMRVHEIAFGSKEANNPVDRPRLVINNTSTFEPVADAYVHAGSPDTNFGSKPDLLVQDPWKQTSSTKNDHGGNGMEIDIMESLGVWGTNKTSHVVHWNGYNKGEHMSWPNPNNPGDPVGLVDISPTADGYHTYGINWQPGRIEFYIDGVKSDREFVNSRTGDIASYILLSHQLGGWDGNTIPPDFQSATMLVDHVRVWSGTPSQ